MLKLETREPAGARQAGVPLPPPSVPPAGEPGGPPRLRFRELLSLGTLLGLFVILETAATTVVMKVQMVPMEWLYTVVSQLYRGWVWAAFAPLVFFFGREFRRWSRFRVVQVALHLVAAGVLLIVGNVLRIWATEATCGHWIRASFTIHNALSQLGPHTIIDFYLYWVVLGIGYFRELAATKRQTELRAEQLRTQLVAAELAALKQQVQPHFLFNSLNAISALMRDGESVRATEALALLASLLRSLLATAGQAQVELRRELDYAECYLAIEKVRFEERLVATFAVEEECLEALVPTLILQPLVENAVKHGIARRLRPGSVRVSAKRVGGQLQLQVANDAADLDGAAGADEHYGIGLRATRSRLDHLFGAGYRLECHFDREGGALVTIELPLQYPAERAIP